MFTRGLLKTALNRDASGVLGNIVGGTAGILSAHKATKNDPSKRSIAVPISGLVSSAAGGIGARKLYSFLKARKK